MLKALLREWPGFAEGGSGQSDAAFGSATAAGDRFRDARDWESAEVAYARALAIRPAEGGYWVQHGHMLKEQNRHECAEVSYRTALALGTPTLQVLEHLRFVMACQGLSESDHPISIARAGSTAERLPTRPDILLLANLLWACTPDTSEIARLMRCHASLDAVFAEMVAHPRFQHVHLQWLNVARPEDV